jgi:hypothetical protein
MSTLIKLAFEQSKAESLVAEGKSFKSADTGKYEVMINLASIYSKLIQEVGRFVEQYASDALYTIDSINKLINDSGETSTDMYYVFALRQCGVDGELSLLNNFTERGSSYTSVYYRKVYVVKVFKQEDNITCSLKEIGDSLEYWYNKSNN